MVALKSSPKKQFLAETRLLAGISRMIDKSSEISNDEAEKLENLSDDDESNIEDNDRQDDEDGEEAEVPPDTARSARGPQGNHNNYQGSKVQNHIPNS